MERNSPSRTRNTCVRNILIVSVFPLRFNFHRKLRRRLFIKLLNEGIKGASSNLHLLFE